MKKRLVLSVASMLLLGSTVISSTSTVEVEDNVPVTQSVEIYTNRGKFKKVGKGNSEEKEEELVG